jgi:hypothetical protein
MKSLFLTLTLVLLCATFIAAVPLETRSKRITLVSRSNRGSNKGGKGAGSKGGNDSTKAASSAAAYFMTNDPNGNFVIASTIAEDGTVDPVVAVATGGIGASGKVETPGPDPLFTQDSLKVGGNFLFVVNPGSNTLSMFNIDPANPTDFRLAGLPVDTSGEFPVSVAFDPSTNHTCVVNGGAVNTVSCFSANAQTGLTPLKNTIRSLGLNQTTPATGPAGTVSDIVFNANGSKLIVSVKGVPPTAGILATFDVAADGSLSENFTASTPAEGGLLPFSLTPIPGKDAVLATDAAIGFATFDFSQGNKATSAVVPIQGQKATCWSSFSNQTQSFFLTDIGTSTVTEVSVNDKLAGSIVKQYPLAADSGTIDNAVATIGRKDFLYVLAPNKTSIDVLSLPSQGNAAILQTVEFGARATAAGLKINPFNLQGMAVFFR